MTYTTEQHSRVESSCSAIKGRCNEAIALFICGKTSLCVPLRKAVIAYRFAKKRKHCVIESWPSTMEPTNLIIFSLAWDQGRCWRWSDNSKLKMAFGKQGRADSSRRKSPADCKTTRRETFHHLLSLTLALILLFHDVIKKYYNDLRASPHTPALFIHYAASLHFFSCSISLFIRTKPASYPTTTRRETRFAGKTKLN